MVILHFLVNIFKTRMFARSAVGGGANRNTRGRVCSQEFKRPPGKPRRETQRILQGNPAGSHIPPRGGLPLPRKAFPVLLTEDFQSSWREDFQFYGADTDLASMR